MNQVLLLESGREEPLAADVPGFAAALQGTDIDWNHRIESDENACLNTTCYWPRGKVIIHRINTYWVVPEVIADFTYRCL